MKYEETDRVKIISRDIIGTVVFASKEEYWVEGDIDDEIQEGSLDDHIPLYPCTEDDLEPTNLSYQDVINGKK